MKRRNIKRVVLTVFFMGVMFLYGCSAGNTPEKNGDQAPVPGHASKTAQSVENKAGEDSADKNGKGTTGLQFGEGSENAAKDSGGGLLTDQVDWPEEDRKEMGFTGEKESGDSEKKEDTSLAIGDIVEGTITGIKEYGAFVALSNGQSGLIHISEMPEAYKQIINQYLSVGKSVTVRVISSHKAGKISLSLKLANQET